MLSEELLKQTAEELALAMNESLPKPKQCHHQFSEEFERKMQLLLSSVVSLFSVDSQLLNCVFDNSRIVIFTIQEL